jgi:flagellar biosynthesis protein FliR
LSSFNISISESSLGGAGDLRDNSVLVGIVLGIVVGIVLNVMRVESEIVSVSVSLGLVSLSVSKVTGGCF